MPLWNPYAGTAAIAAHTAISDAHQTAYSFVELAGGAYDPGVQDTWVDWDISGSVPVDAVYALILIINIASAENVAGARKDGSGLDRKWQLGRYSQAAVLTEIGPSRVIEIWQDSATRPLFHIIGYWYKP